MKLIFKKDEDSQISVVQDIDGKKQEFKYVDMIKALIESKELEEPEIEGDFTDAEEASIKRMVKFINDEVGTDDDDEVEEEEEDFDL
ncbi:MAG: hypothetical protein KAJ07_02050 [Planctomycetes bacterium]|nr:hypothetical protein [Planctomycetota bacterium]